MCIIYSLTGIVLFVTFLNLYYVIYPIRKYFLLKSLSGVEYKSVNTVYSEWRMNRDPLDCWRDAKSRVDDTKSWDYGPTVGVSKTRSKTLFSTSLSHNTFFEGPIRLNIGPNFW